jgi:hypothetical protein
MMSDPDNISYAKTPSLLTIKGHVSVQFLDGQTLEGEFVSQDQFNIFLKSNGEPIMIPRAQIRFIKGKQVEQIMEDDSLEMLAQPHFQQPMVRPEAGQRARFDTEEYVLPSVMPSAAEEDEDGTVVLDTLALEQLALEDDEGTMVIDIDQYPLEQTEDDGTVVLPAGLDTLTWDKDDDTNDGTLVLDQLPLAETEDDLDMTMVMPDIPETDEEDTGIIEAKKEPEIKAKLVCTTGPHAGEVLELRSGITTLGRSSDNVFVLSQDKGISRHHAIILQESGRFVVQDQNSLNGTFVNDEQIAGPHYLKDGDEILVGLSTLKYQED